MPLVKRVRYIGNAAGVIFDRPVLRQAGWDVGTPVRVDVKEDRIVLTRHEDEPEKGPAVRPRKGAAR